MGLDLSLSLSGTESGYEACLCARAVPGPGPVVHVLTPSLPPATHHWRGGWLASTFWGNQDTAGWAVVVIRTAEPFNECKKWGPA